MSSIRGSIACVLVSAFAVSCSSSSTESSSQSLVEDHGWQLSSYKLLGLAERAALDNGALSFHLQSQTGVVSGFIECNAFSGRFTLDGSILSLSEIGSDDASCFEDSDHYREQNTLINNVLSQQIEVLVEGELLTWSASDGNVLTFAEYPEVFISQPVDE